MHARVLSLLLAAPLVSGCVFHSHIDALSGVAGVRGEPIEYQTTSSWALHGLWIYPILGDATTGGTLEAFAAEAAERGATRMRVTQTSTFTYWFLLPPLSFFIHPVHATVEGDVEGTVTR